MCSALVVEPRGVNPARDRAAGRAAFSDRFNTIHQRPSWNRVTSPPRSAAPVIGGANVTERHSGGVVVAREPGEEAAAERITGEVVVEVATACRVVSAGAGLKSGSIRLLAGSSLGAFRCVVIGNDAVLAVGDDLGRFNAIEVYVSKGSDLGGGEGLDDVDFCNGGNGRLGSRSDRWGAKGNSGEREGNGDDGGEREHCVCRLGELQGMVECSVNAYYELALSVCWSEGCRVCFLSVSTNTSLLKYLNVDWDSQCKCEPEFTTARISGRRILRSTDETGDINGAFCKADVE